MKLSIIIPVLDSHEIVWRQYQRFVNILKIKNYPDVELIIVDDGSIPSLFEYLTENGVIFKSHQRVRNCPVYRNGNIYLVQTNNFKPWTQGIASNIGFELSTGKYIMHLDVDHFLRNENITNILTTIDDEFDCVKFGREWGYIMPDGNISRKKEHIGDIDDPGQRINPNIYVMNRQCYIKTGGYNENRFGKYWGDDIEFFERYTTHGFKISFSETYIYVFPHDFNTENLFHTLTRI